MRLLRLSPRWLHALLLTLSFPLLAWGPHPEITDAAVAALPRDAALRTELGPHIAKLPDHCWMGDMRRTLVRREEGWFYADDCLLFPSMEKHRDHICPEVKETYEPFFRQALQALRTQTPENAARWIGGILHFTEDTGSPPHAAEIRGEVHSKMENWVDAKAIHLGDYKPQLLGRTDDEAVAGYLKRMDGLIEFSKSRAERAKPFVLANDRPSAEPIVLESALETSRVVADLLYTLGELTKAPVLDTAKLTGRITSTSSPLFAKLPARVMLSGTSLSTLADAQGRYEFRQVKPGAYKLIVLRAGCKTVSHELTLSPNNATVLDLSLPPDEVAGNLIRNSSATALWLSPQQPDAWYPVKKRLGEAYWEGELIPVKPGTTYKLQTLWQPEAKGQVVVQLLPKDIHSKGNVLMTPLLPGTSEMTFTATPEAAFAQILISGQPLPGAVCKHVALTPVPAP